MNSYSIIIPVYNVPIKYLNRILECIKSQLYTNFEIIWVNDNSNNIQTINWLKNVDIGKVVWNVENYGLGIARNIGIKNSKNDYLVFIDPDDFIKNDFLYKIENEIKVNKDNVYQINYSKVKNKEVINNKKIIRLFDIHVFSQTTWSLIIKREFVIKNNLFFLDKKIIHEDEYFFIKLLNQCDKINLLNDNLYFYNISNNESITKKNKYYFQFRKHKYYS